MTGKIFKAIKKKLKIKSFVRMQDSVLTINPDCDDYLSIIGVWSAQCRNGWEGSADYASDSIEFI
jgi:hypothetical protein